jgi:hypothetical protein
LFWGGNAVLRWLGARRGSTSLGDTFSEVISAWVRSCNVIKLSEEMFLGRKNVCYSDATDGPQPKPRFHVFLVKEKQYTSYLQGVMRFSWSGLCPEVLLNVYSIVVNSYKMACPKYGIIHTPVFFLSSRDNRDPVWRDTATIPSSTLNTPILCLAHPNKC